MTTDDVQALREALAASVAKCARYADLLKRISDDAGDCEKARTLYHPRHRTVMEIRALFEVDA